VEFLLNIEFVTPEGLALEELDLLRRRESERARELAELGVLIRLWRVPGKWANWGLWRAQDVDALWSFVDSLPLRQYASVVVHPLEPHPSDPDLH
jgi:muconolactone delta-isomerase